jgi:hypothetical protein
MHQTPRKSITMLRENACLNMRLFSGEERARERERGREMGETNKY